MVVWQQYLLEKCKGIEEVDEKGVWIDSTLQERKTRHILSPKCNIIDSF